jgi:hypothetical protein
MLFLISDDINFKYVDNILTTSDSFTQVRYLGSISVNCKLGLQMQFLNTFFGFVNTCGSFLPEIIEKSCKSNENV